ncbi:MAG: hypothetical protein HOV66_08100 [Streptomycetaceae bacterium]|jgi:hypothetical protein|uniref:Uncharacterized protein n=1 Tax=Yinghuangia aomiensis TaxID=676205 RepID=A0ABP9GJT1_9ACTN|nr:hypothetical protein [Streptomycetaceae bacterium]NUS54811.1 hypothetical protein [Streptomycetaceae bacterium]
MLEYEYFRARENELHRAAEHERTVSRALRTRREQRRQARLAERDSRSSSTGGIAGSVRPAL